MWKQTISLLPLSPYSLIVLWTLHLFIRLVCFAPKLTQAPIPMSSVDLKPLAYVCPQGRSISCRENGKTYKADPLSNRWWICNLNPIQFPTPCLHSSSFLRRLELTCCPICCLQQEGQGLLLVAGLGTFGLNCCPQGKGKGRIAW